MDKLKDICTQFVYIPHYTEKTASLNVAIATSICLQRFTSWAGYVEAPIYGEKFLDPVKQKREYEEGIRKLKEKHEGGDAGGVEDSVEKKLKTE